MTDKKNMPFIYGETPPGKMTTLPVKPGDPPMERVDLQDQNPYDIVQTHVDTASNEYGVERDLINSVINAESSFRREAESERGAVGYMQITPEIAEQYGVTDPLDAIQNIRAGTQYLRDLNVRFKGDKQKVIMAYHMGPTAVAEGKIPGPKTEAYVEKVTEGQKKPHLIREAYAKLHKPTPRHGIKEREPTKSEAKWFAGEGRKIPGMASKDNNVVMNPNLKLSKAARQSVVSNETARAYMKKFSIHPDFELTKAQKAKFKNYGSEQDIRETVAARILAGDKSAGVVTEAQQKFANKLAEQIKTHGINRNPRDPKGY